MATRPWQNLQLAYNQRKTPRQLAQDVGRVLKSVVESINNLLVSEPKKAPKGIAQKGMFPKPASSDIAKTNKEALRCLVPELRFAGISGSEEAPFLTLARREASVSLLQSLWQTECLDNALPDLMKHLIDLILLSTLSQMNTNLSQRA
eukprot:4396806-Amphidinium_carterae.1